LYTTGPGAEAPKAATCEAPNSKPLRATSEDFDFMMYGVMWRDVRIAAA